jgi:hypothetical protein
MWARFPDGRADYCSHGVSPSRRATGHLGRDDRGVRLARSDRRRHRRLILELLEVLVFDAPAQVAFQSWLLAELFPNGTRLGRIRRAHRQNMTNVFSKRRRSLGPDAWLAGIGDPILSPRRSSFREVRQKGSSTGLTHESQLDADLARPRWLG